MNGIFGYGRKGVSGKLMQSSIQSHDFFYLQLWNTEVETHAGIIYTLILSRLFFRVNLIQS